MSAEFIFVLVTSDTCGACKRFIPLTWVLLKEKLEQDGRFSISHLEYKTVRNGERWDRVVQNTEFYNAGITSYIKFYPAFFIIPAADWFGSAHDLTLSKKNLYGVDDTFNVMDHTPMDITSIWKWISESELLNVVKPSIVKKSKYSSKVTIRRSRNNDEVL